MDLNSISINSDLDIKSERMGPRAPTITSLQSHPLEQKIHPLDMNEGRRSRNHSGSSTSSLAASSFDMFYKRNASPPFNTDINSDADDSTSENDSIETPREVAIEATRRVFKALDPLIIKYNGPIHRGTPTQKFFSLLIDRMVQHMGTERSAADTPCKQCKWPKKYTTKPFCSAECEIAYPPPQQRRSPSLGDIRPQLGRRCSSLNPMFPKEASAGQRRPSAPVFSRNDI